MYVLSYKPHFGYACCMLVKVIREHSVTELYSYTVISSCKGNLEFDINFQLLKLLYNAKKWFYKSDSRVNITKRAHSIYVIKYEE